MSRLFKNIMQKSNNRKFDDITNYLIAEIEDIVSKKVSDSNNFRDKSNAEDYKYKSNRINKHNKINNKEYSSHINYELKREQPFKAAEYLYEENKHDFLPFNELEIQPQLDSEEQIKSIVKNTLRPALNQWLDENLDIIIEKAVKRKYSSKLYNNKKINQDYFK